MNVTYTNKRIKAFIVSIVNVEREIKYKSDAPLILTQIVYIVTKFHNVCAVAFTNSNFLLSNACAVVGFLCGLSLIRRVRMASI